MMLRSVLTSKEAEIMAWRHTPGLSILILRVFHIKSSQTISMFQLEEAMWSDPSDFMENACKDLPSEHCTKATGNL